MLTAVSSKHSALRCSRLSSDVPHYRTEREREACGDETLDGSNMCAQDVGLTVEVTVIFASSRVTLNWGAGEAPGQICLLVGL